jgi:hypothetical protein
VLQIFEQHDIEAMLDAMASGAEPPSHTSRGRQSRRRGPRPLFWHYHQGQDGYGETKKRQLKHICRDLDAVRPTQCGAFLSV